MKKTLTARALSLIVVLASVCSLPARADSPAANPLSKAQGSAEAGKPSLAGELWNRTELYFGSAKPDGSMVSRPEFRRFVDEKVTPFFPDGLTVVTGYGQFRSAAGVLIKERSQVLILFYPLKTRDANQKIQAIRDAYKHAFRQESVLRVDSLALLSF